MKVSRTWLQKYFNEPLPDTQMLANELTFHAFEIEEASGDLLDIKVLPNRAADCLSHRGIAKELSAILGIPLKFDPLREALQGSTSHDKVESCNELRVQIEDSEKCARYMGALVRGVKVGPSPAWLKEALEAAGQRSINNIVDATNYVMLDIGQPLHAFDASRLAQKDGAYAIAVRSAKASEALTTLSNETYRLTPDITVITDANAGIPIALAGIKGGKAAELTDTTVDVVVEAANFDGTTTRRAAQSLKLFTDASLRFQNRPSPELVAYAMRDVIALITDIAGGEVAGITDEYPLPKAAGTPVPVSLAKVNGVLGSAFAKDEVESVFKRLSLSYMIVDDTFAITPPFERTDLGIAEDLIEEVGRILGYDRIEPAELPPIEGTPDQARYRGIEKIKDQLVAQGFTEISTQTFATKGAIALANPLDKAKPALRASLADNMKEALQRAKYAAPLVLAPNEKPRLFEIGTVFAQDGETLDIETSEPLSDPLSITDDASYEPEKYDLGAFRPFSAYPFIARDIALWAPLQTDSAAVAHAIRAQASDLLVRLDQFDRFEKDGKVSFAFRLVFQSMDRTLTDDEVNGIMTSIAEALAWAGFTVR